MVHGNVCTVFEDVHAYESTRKCSVDTQVVLVIMSKRVMSLFFSSAASQA